jgi:hypothetical protein
LRHRNGPGCEADARPVIASAVASAIIASANGSSAISYGTPAIPYGTSANPYGTSANPYGTPAGATICGERVSRNARDAERAGCHNENDATI